VAGPPVDLSAYAGQRLGASTLRAATADIMADITGLLTTIRQQTPPAVPYDLAVPGGRLSSGRTDDGASSGATASQGEAAQEADPKTSGQA